MDSVSVAFELMRFELEAEVESLNSEGADCFRNSEYELAKELINRGERLSAFCKKVAILRDEWESGISNEFPESDTMEQVENVRKTILSASKSSKTVLLVRFPDGEVFAEKTAAETLVKVIQKIGFEKVANVGVVVNGENIVSREASQRYNDAPIPPYFVKTHSSTSQKKKNLEQISEALGIGLEISIV